MERLGELLRSPAEQAKEGLLIVVGPSGCGKSSLVKAQWPCVKPTGTASTCGNALTITRLTALTQGHCVKAGVAPAMANEDHWFVLPPMRPGATPLSELARILAEGFLALGRSTTVADVRNHLQTRGLVSLLDELRVVARRLDVRRILLIVDQLEELVTHAGAKESAQFAALLAPGMQGCLSVLATLRPDFLDAVLADPARAGLPLRRIFGLRPLDRESVYSIIEGPAEVAGLKVDGKLTRRLIEDGGTGDALPLIAFTLSRLADGLHRGDELSMRRYEDLGGVRAALQKRADLALAAAVLVGGRSRKQVVRGLLQLVAVDREGAPTRMQIVVDQLPPLQRKEFDAFVAERLLTLSSVDDETRISVAHEAIFSVWPPLSEEIDQARAELRLRAVVEALAHDWEADGRHPSLLLHGPRLTEAQAFWGAGGSAAVDLSDRARAFLQESHTRQVRTERQERLNTRLLRQVIAAGVFFVLVCIAISIGARILILAQQDLNLLQRAHDAVDTDLVDPQQLASTPTGAILASDIRLALLYDNGLAQSAGGASTAPPMGNEELAVAQGFAKSSVRTASGGGLTYRVVAVVAGEGRALVLGQNIQQALRTILILGIALAVPALIGAALAVSPSRPQSPYRYGGTVPPVSRTRVTAPPVVTRTPVPPVGVAAAGAVGVDRVRTDMASPDWSMAPSPGGRRRDRGAASARPAGSRREAAREPAGPSRV